MTQDFDEIATWTDHDLYAAIGESLLDGLFHMHPGELRRRLVAMGRTWMESHLDELRDLLCVDPRIVGLRQMAEASESEWIAAIADVLSAKGGYPPVSVVAVLTARHGIARLCG